MTDDETRRQVREKLVEVANLLDPIGWYDLSSVKQDTLRMLARRSAAEALALLAQPGTPAQPKTCATCRHWDCPTDGTGSWCQRPKSPMEFMSAPGDFGCSLHEAVPAADARAE